MFHWTYEEFESQPAFFIEDILLCLQQEANKEKQQSIKAARGRGIPRNG